MALISAISLTGCKVVPAFERFFLLAEDAYKLFFVLTGSLRFELESLVRE